MIKHIVFFKLKEKNNLEKQKIAGVIKSRLMELPHKINEIVFFEVGINIVESDRSYDIALVSEFKTIDDLNAYRDHPAHIEMIEFLKLYRESTVSVDYENLVTIPCKSD